MTSWLEMRAEDWTLGQATLFDVDDAPAEPIERPGTLFEPAPELVDVGQLAAELDDMKAATKRLNRQAARARLRCGHRGDVPDGLADRAKYRTVFCDECQDVSLVCRRRPSRRRIGGSW